MTDTFLLSLDTTAPAVTLHINAGAPSTDQTLVNLNLGFDADAFEVKVWGDIDPTDILNADYGEDESGAGWIPIGAVLQARLLPGDGPKTVRIRARDEVWNETDVVSDTITLGAVPAEPTEARQMPTRARPKRTRAVKRFPPSVLEVKDRFRLYTFHRDDIRLGVAELAFLHAVANHDGSPRLGVQVETAVAVSHQHHLGAGAYSETSVRKRAEGPKTEAALDALDII